VSCWAHQPGHDALQFSSADIGGTTFVQKIRLAQLPRLVAQVDPEQVEPA
jgi:hypothetical protein